MRVAITLGILLLMATWSGCGTTKWSDTARTATEQLLITDSIDRAVSRLDLRALAGKKVSVDDTPAKSVTDSAYLVSAVRQHVLASGAILKDKKDDAEYILEVRAGAVGTDRNDILFGIPATNLPTMPGAVAVPSQIPEIALAKKTDQRAVAKISLFAYNRETGRPVWQSGATPVESQTKALWVLGAGPFQRGSIRRGTTFAGDHVRIPLIDPMLAGDGTHSSVSVADEAFFVEPKEPSAKTSMPAVAGQPGTQGKDQTAAATAAAVPAGASAAAPPPNAMRPPEIQSAAPRPDFPTGPAGFARPQPGDTYPDRQVERIRDVPPTPSYGTPGPPLGDSRPSGPWPTSSGVSPAAAEMPAPSSSPPAQPAENVRFGDIWLDRRR
jgi:hypothetical protein